MSERQSEDQSGLIMYLNRQSLPIRLAAFIVFVVLIIGVIVGITVGLYYANVANFPRLDPTAVDESVRVAEFVTFDDQEAYPSAVASAEDGTLYTGSFVSGAIWRVESSGELVEIPNTRTRIGAVIGLDVASDGTVYILDQLDDLNPTGARVWQLTPDGDLIDENLVDMSIRPNDIAVDTLGRIYILDIGNNQILRSDNGEMTSWWDAPFEDALITGLAYDSATDTLLVTDAGRSAVYAVSTSTDDTQTAYETVFILNDTSVDLPFFNGIDVTSDGVIYVAGLDASEIWRVDSETTYTVIAGNYRGSSDVAYDPENNRLYVNNWDQSWLIPITLVIFQVDVPPRLPFSVDVIDLAP